ncbi:hypothetical protein AAFF_G00351400 [Aldrovandia affinis]|uniref:Uncharacterized protein n=1 Tax=Aldrovandia affinis TaxID=143900 RepID=A0AAD7SJD0_9TELE|nr:hypothetical protein AAFF_G00351400 [Aldrovandia affinis]
MLLQEVSVQTWSLDYGVQTFDPDRALPEWTWRWWLSWWPLDMGCSALPRSELRTRVCGIPRGCTRKWLPGPFTRGSRKWLQFPAVCSPTPDDQLKAINKFGLLAAEGHLEAYLKDCFVSHWEGVGWCFGEWFWRVFLKNCFLDC